MRRTILKFTIIFAALSWALIPSSTIAQDYRLGPQDKVRLSVHEWRAAVSEVFEWEALTREFTVSAAGEISVPLVGNVMASGLTVTELADVISKRMQKLIGLANVPTVSLEIAQYRPFYIVGSVDKPGEYPFRPGLTVLQALGIAGGLQKISDLGLLRLGRDIITQTGEIEQLTASRDALRVRKARLDAELSGLDKLVFPDDLQKRVKDPALVVAIEQESAIFTVRRTALKTELDALTGLKSYLTKEVDSLQAQLQAQSKERTLVQKELSNVSSLVERGLAVSPRQLGLERTAAQLEGERLRLETTLLKARQEISRAEISIIDVRNKSATEITASARETTARIDDMQAKLITAQKLLYEAEVSAPRSLALRRRNLLIQPRFEIVRNAGGNIATLAATDASPVEPGDTVKVDLPVPDDFINPGN